MRVYSKHEAVHVTLQEVTHLVRFAEESPGIYVAEVANDIAGRLLEVGEAGGFWPGGEVEQPEPEVTANAESGHLEQSSEEAEHGKGRGRKRQG